jgi:hypothetical protein
VILSVTHAETGFVVIMLIGIENGFGESFVEMLRDFYWFMRQSEDLTDANIRCVCR